MKIARAPSTTLILAACLALAKTAHADDPREQQAEPIYREGLKLHDKGLEAEALEKFRQSYAIYPSPAALNSIARLELLLGKELESLRHFRQVIANPLTHPQTAQKARENIQYLEARLGRLMVRAPDGTVLVIDGERYLAPVTLPIDVQPGDIHVEGSFGEVRYEGRATAVKGTVVALDLKRVGPSPIVEQPTEPPPVGPTQGSFWGWRSIGGLGLVGAGAVAIIIGVAGKSEQSSQDDKMTSLTASLPPGEPGTRCFGSALQACADYRDARAARDAAQTRGNTWLPIGIGAAVVGAALVASAAFWPYPRPSASASKQPHIIPTMGRSEAGFLFVSDF